MCRQRSAGRSSIFCVAAVSVVLRLRAPVLVDEMTVESEVPRDILIADLVMTNRII